MATTVNFAVLSPAVQLVATPTTLITGAAGSQTQIKRAVFTNVGTVATTITAWRAAFGTVPDVTNEIIPTRPIAANSTDLAPELAGMVLNGGDIISAQAGTITAVNFFASGIVAT